MNAANQPIVMLAKRQRIRSDGCQQITIPRISRGRCSWRAKAGAAQRPGGFTLLELLLVLALMVTLLTLVGANLRGGFRQQRLLKSGDQMRTAWAKARVQAIKTGRVQVFHHAPDSTQYFTTAQQSFDDPSGLSAFPGSDPSTSMGFGNPAEMNNLDEMGMTPVRPLELPRDIRFVGAEVKIDQRSAFQLSEAVDPATLISDSFAFADRNPDTGQAPRWGTPIYFFPDGTSSSARLVLTNSDGQTVSVYLRGLTGVSQVGPVIAADDLSFQEPLR